MPLGLKQFNHSGSRCKSFQDHQSIIPNKCYNAEKFKYLIWLNSNFDMCQGMKDNALIVQFIHITCG